MLIFNFDVKRMFVYNWGKCSLGDVNMALIPAESYPFFEKMIYLPMVITVLELDRQLIEKSPFKLKKPYINIIEQAIKYARSDLKDTKLYMRENRMKLLRRNVDDTTTTYMFFYGGYEQERRYLNVRLRNRTEEMLEVYLVMA